MSLKSIMFFMLAVVLTQSAYAQTAGQVKAAQFPSWVNRGGHVIAIQPGLKIEEGDKVHTGRGGKILLSMNDGSDIKLGNSSQIEIKKVENAAPQNNNVFGLALNVLKGVFRFTTSLVDKNRKRDVAISFGTVTAGIRGTDIWGRTNSEQDLVCLLEGNIEVTHPQSSPVVMNEARQYYDAKPNEAGALKGKVDTEQIEIWANLTEIDKTQGVMQGEGKWSVVLMSLTKLDLAQQFSEQLNQQGYPTEIYSLTINGQRYHRVIMKQFEYYKDAMFAKKRLNEVQGVNNAWVKKYAF